MNYRAAFLQALHETAMVLLGSIAIAAIAAGLSILYLIIGNLLFHCFLHSIWFYLGFAVIAGTVTLFLVLFVVNIINNNPAEE